VTLAMPHMRHRLLLLACYATVTRPITVVDFGLRGVARLIPFFVSAKRIVTNCTTNSKDLAAIPFCVLTSGWIDSSDQLPAIAFPVVHSFLCLVLVVGVPKGWILREVEGVRVYRRTIKQATIDVAAAKRSQDLGRLRLHYIQCVFVLNIPKDVSLINREAKGFQCSKQRYDSEGY
jgi:hypothetical protein